MENNLYTNLGNRINRTYQDKRDLNLLTIKDFLDNKWVIHNNIELKRTFINELKKLLKKENLFDLIESFFELESDLHSAEEKLMLDEIVSFDEFYKNLSPVIMRSLLEQAKSSQNSEIILASIKESIRIAIEEQIYQIEA